MEQSMDMSEIVLRKAQIEDMQKILPHIVEFRLDCENLKHEQFVIAEVKDEIAGFGRIKPYSEMFELSTIGVIKGYREKGVGNRIIKHLIETFPSNEIWITTKIPDYFAKFGFQMTPDPPKEIQDKCKRVCKSFDETNTEAIYMVLSK